MHHSYAKQYREEGKKRIIQIEYEGQFQIVELKQTPEFLPVYQTTSAN